MDPDEIRAELVAILDRLGHLPDDAFAERSDLRRRQNELRSLLARPASAHDQESLQGLRERIVHLTRRVEAIRGEHLSHLAGVGSGIGGAIDPEHVLRLNRLIDQAAGADELLDELKRLRSRLEELER